MLFYKSISNQLLEMHWRIGKPNNFSHRQAIRLGMEGQMRGKGTVMPCSGMMRMPGQVRVKAVRVKCRSASREADRHSFNQLRSLGP